MFNAEKIFVNWPSVTIALSDDVKLSNKIFPFYNNECKDFTNKVNVEKWFKKNKPDYIIILPWNIKEEIIKTYNFVKTWGCKFLVLLPKIKKY